ncbi:velvet factor [Polychytrium aggregatum]|uniref:velvet factor n=1 Tax=Polychytrium aggregatum TaxID=110093 RepID=UPI0022FE6920|nr:velvet factor [Polychytrium aggregatum]KAI9205272.1 velvet factor [Polychytrium aggregatum]
MSQADSAVLQCLFPSLPTQDPFTMYALSILDHPFQVRCSGFSNKVMGRKIDPIPVLQLSYYDPAQQIHVTDASALSEASRFVVYVQLFSEDGMQNLSNVLIPPNRLNRAAHASPLTPEPTTFQSKSEIAPGAVDFPRVSSASSSVVMQEQAGTHPSQVVPSLFGTLVSPSYFTRDLDQRLGVYFIFGDLSLRVEGTFRLKFLLFDLAASLPIPDMNTPSRPIATVLSNPFMSHSWKSFPGMNRISPLTRHIINQGIVKIIRRANLTRDCDQPECLASSP